VTACKLFLLIFIEEKQIYFLAQFICAPTFSNDKQS
jgi:hypothetical protein